MKGIRKKKTERRLGKRGKEYRQKQRLVKELIDLGSSVVALEEAEGIKMSERSCFLHPEVRTRAREIGKQLWAITKDNDPDYMLWVFQCDLLSLPRWTHTELERVWDGIGNIRA